MTAHPTPPPPDPAVQAALDSASQLNDRVLVFVREHPAASMVGALALGFVVGKIASRM